MSSETLGQIVLGTLVLVNWFATRKAQTQIKEVHLTMNSRLDALVKAREDVARGEGHAAGIVEGKKDYEK